MTFLFSNLTSTSQLISVSLLHELINITVMKPLALQCYTFFSPHQIIIVIFPSNQWEIKLIKIISWFPIFRAIGGNIAIWWSRQSPLVVNIHEKMGCFNMRNHGLRSQELPIIMVSGFVVAITRFESNSIKPQIRQLLIIPYMNFAWWYSPFNMRIVKGALSDI